MFSESNSQEIIENEPIANSEPETPISIKQLDLTETNVVTSTLNIRGNKIGQNRPRTSPFKINSRDHNDGSQSPDSIAATFTIREGRTERQTKIKLESLERRLKANEKARREIEEEAEKWKNKAEKNSKRLPDLEVELAEVRQSKDEWMAKSQEIEIYNKQLTEEKEKLQEKLSEAEEGLNFFSRKIMTLMNAENDLEGLEPIKHLEVLENEIIKFQTKCSILEKENEDLKYQNQEYLSKLSTNQNHVSTLMEHLETNKLQSQEIHGICKKELEIRQHQDSRANHDISLLNSTINEQKHEIEMLKAEIRCLRSFSQEMSTANRNNIILLKSSESERSSLLETLSVLLDADMKPTESNIKKMIRDLVHERNTEKTKRLEAEKVAAKAEGVLLDTAKQQRNALFRARISEDEFSKAMEKCDELEQELLASDLERKNLEHQIDSFQNCISKLSQMLNINVGSVYDALFERIEDLVNQESVYRLVINENRLISDNLIRGLQNVRKEFQGSTNVGKSIESSMSSKKVAMPTSSHQVVTTAAKIIQERAATMKTIDKMDKLNKDLLATMTIETLRAADIEKLNMKKKMTEQEQRIRKLEKEKREGERIRSIIAKWEKRNVSKPKQNSTFDKPPIMRKAPSMEHLRPKSQASATGLLSAI